MLHGDARRRCWVAAAAQGAGGRDAATGMLPLSGNGGQHVPFQLSGRLMSAVEWRVLLADPSAARAQRASICSSKREQRIMMGVVEV
jgi:hypothetical protein